MRQPQRRTPAPGSDRSAPGGARSGVLKGGVGTASGHPRHPAASGVTVGAIVVVNSVGNVVNPLRVCRGSPRCTTSWGLVAPRSTRPLLWLP